MDRARHFREAAARENWGRSKRGWRYSPELRHLAVEYCQAQRQAGVSWSEISTELGVSALSLGRWLAEEPRASFRPVEVIADQEASERAVSLVVVTPGGLRIEGLAWSQVLELARSFA